MPSNSLSGSEAPDVQETTSGPPEESRFERAGPLSEETRAGLRILVVDDERTICESCSSILESEGYDVTVSNRGDEALQLLKRRRFDIMLVDLYMSQVPGLELLRAGLEAHRDMIPIVITGHPSVNSSIEALRAGAWDYLPKPFSATQLEVMVGRAAHAAIAARDARELQAEIEKEHGNSEKVTVLGVSPAFRKTIELARTVAPTDASVFVYGESGTGKELIAQFIHHHSRRSKKPLVAVNCAALPETLLESEMFGHCKGAFTGAVREKPGLLEAADGGTLFLDEILEMPPPIQAKLLRVIQDGVVRRVGSTKTDAVVNVRFICATNRDPEEASDSGNFRHDLYYRLRVVPIYVPPLRERPEDIPVLAKHFLAKFWKRHRERGAQMPKLTEEAVRALQARPWPGNVRELENAIEHTVVFLKPGVEIEPDDIPNHDSPHPSVRQPASFPIELMGDQYHEARDRVLAEFERRYLGWILNRAGGNMSKAARIAGIDRTTIYRLMEKRGLRRSVLMTDAE